MQKHNKREMEKMRDEMYTAIQNENASATKELHADMKQLQNRLDEQAEQIHNVTRLLQKLLESQQ